ncbi:MAG TPA: hypothetical protein VIV11_31045 [Kofleriaceae bacterium]
MRLLALVAFITLTGCTSDDDCPLYDRGGVPEIAANELRDPNTGVCQPYGGGGGCESSCGPCLDTTQAYPDWGQCYSHCEALDESACKTTSGCRAAYSDTSFYQCWAVAQSGPVQGGDCTQFDAYECSRHDDCSAIHATGNPIGSFRSCAEESSIQDPGSCVGEVTCDALPPNCPAGTIAGRRNGCWTGYCIPIADCDQLPACSTLNENDCIGRTDCTPTYEGQNCTCNANGCTCQTWTFDSCKAM